MSRPILLALLLWGVVLPLSAEVAISLNPANDAPTSVLVGSIVDETDPINSWSPFGSSSPTRIALNPDGDVNGDGPPSVVYEHGRTDPVVVWSRNAAEGYELVASRFTGGAWTNPVVIVAGTADDLDPEVVVDPEDDLLHVFYWTADPSPRVMWTRGAFDLTGWQTPVQVSAPSDTALRPSAAFHGGVLKVAYENHFSGLDLAPREIVIATGIDSDTFSWDSLQTTLHDEPNRPQAHSSHGRLWIEWVDASGAMGWIRESLSAGSWEPMQTETFQTVEEREFSVRQEIRLQAID